jgi:hypothetical protein
LDVYRILFFLFIFATLTIILSIFFLDQVPVDDEPEPEDECIEGTETDCKRGTCNGTATCINGAWGECYIEKVCERGRIYPCTMEGCGPGYRICNPCEDGFGECIFED